MNKTFGTKKGVLLGLVIWGALFAAFFRVGLPGMMNLQTPHLIMQPLIFLFVGTIWFGIRYQVTEKELQIKLGPFTPWKVDIMDIQAISRSYNPLSSPATSLRRISFKIKGGGLLLLSPLKEKEFIQALVKVNPEIKNKMEEDNARGFTRFLYWLL
ncbi:MAG: PH domain-containing protein [Bacteroidota bacterium]